MKTKFSLHIVKTFGFFIMAFAFANTPATAMTISANAHGYLPPLATVPGDNTPDSDQKLINDEFTITPSVFDPGHTQPLGDGNNELTSWTFDFSKDANFPIFHFAAPLTHAWFSITLTKLGDIIDNDGLGPYRTPPAVSPTPVEINSQPLGVTTTVTFDLLKYFSSAELLGSISLLPADLGQMPFLYGDDAIVSFAQLRLVNQDATVPEPSSLLLVAIGIIGLAIRQGKLI